MEEVFKLVQDLHTNPPASPVAETVVSEDPDLPTPHSEAGTEAAMPTLLPPTITSETVAEAVRPPLLLAKRAMATLAPRKGRPNPPPLQQPSAREGNFSSQVGRWPRENLRSQKPYLH